MKFLMKDAIKTFIAIFNFENFISSEDQQFRKNKRLACTDLENLIYQDYVVGVQKILLSTQNVLSIHNN